MKRKICVITGTRAEYGLLRRVMRCVRDDGDLTLQIIATGMHLSPEFGLTYREIEQDGFEIDRKIEMLVSADTPSGIAKSMGLGLIGFADAFSALAPDLIVVLGDRYEILSAVSAALAARIPIAHIHGGEATEGLIDEAIRHSITKMSHLHFVAAEEYRHRVIQLGEQPERVFMVGGLGVDAITHTELLDKVSLERNLDFSFGAKSALVTFHPVTLEALTAETQMAALLGALRCRPDINVLFTMPNADTDGRILMRMVNAFVQEHPNSRAYTSLGQLRYLSCLAQVDLVIGNSSSGLAEVPSFRKPTVNIGDRQRGRLQAASVINCAPNQEDIARAIESAFEADFQRSMGDVQNPYGDGGASERIVDQIKNCRLDNLLKKRFFDLPNICV